MTLTLHVVHADGSRTPHTVIVDDTFSGLVEICDLRPGDKIEFPTRVTSAPDTTISIINAKFL